jgi:membrane protease YdiL (CAAX protease family)
MLAGGYFALDGLALSGVSAVTQGALWLIVFTLTGIGEECLWRGYIQTTLTRGMGFWRAGILASLLFALAHSTNPGETALGIAQVFVAGMIFVVILRVSGSLWPGIGFHAGWDWGQSYFYGTPDSGFLSDGHLLNSHPVGAALFSGGSVGPEGSVLATPVFFLGASIFVWLLRRLPKK